ncbi:hypothetical protein ACUXV3_01910 [Roseobacteraceae bacterium NS-SX3]
MEEIPLWSLWWVWGAAALLLAILEVLVPGFIFLGFAIGAAAVALLLLAAGSGWGLPGVLMALTGSGWGLPVLLLGFAVLSLAAWLALRRLFALPKGQVKTFDRDIND